MLPHGKKAIDFIPFEENTPRSIKLPRDRKIRSIDLYFNAQLVISGGSASGTVVADAPLQVIPEIRVQGNGSINLFRNDARGMYIKKGFEYSTKGYIVPPDSGAEATINIACFLHIDFQNNLGINPSDSFLPAYEFQSLNLIVRWGTLADMFEGGFDRDCAISTAYGITAVIHEADLPTPKLIRIQDYIESEVTANRSNFPIDIDVGDMTYQAFMLLTTDAGCRESDIINLISLLASPKSVHLEELPFDLMQHSNKLQFAMESSAIGTVVDAGIVYLYMLEEGLITTGLNLKGINSCKFKLDVTVGTGTTIIRCYYDVMHPVRNVLGV